MSPNRRAVDKIALGLYIPIELKYQLERKAQIMGVSMTSLLVAILTDHTRDVELDADDYRKIADLIERRKNERKG